jgi:hypothetical protein
VQWGAGHVSESGDAALRVKASAAAGGTAFAQFGGRQGSRNAILQLAPVLGTTMSKILDEPPVDPVRGYFSQQCVLLTGIASGVVEPTAGDALRQTSASRSGAVSKSALVYIRTARIGATDSPTPPSKRPPTLRSTPRRRHCPPWTRLVSVRPAPPRATYRRCRAPGPPCAPASRKSSRPRAAASGSPPGGASIGAPPASYGTTPPVGKSWLAGILFGHDHQASTDI